MKGFAALLSLPAAILTLLSTPIAFAYGEHSPHDALQSSQYDKLVKRECEAQDKLAQHVPIGVKKMSGSEDEKFFLHYWDFGGSESYNYSATLLESGFAPDRAWLQPGTMPHMDLRVRTNGLFGRSLFARGFKCPGNTYSCKSSIGADICCEPDQSCVSTNAGPGCCPRGKDCGNSIGGCPSGYTACNDGCCIPGAVCKNAGCILYSVGSTTTTTLFTVTRTSGLRSSTVTGPGRTVTVFVPTVRVSTKTIIIGGGTKTKTLIASSSTTARITPSPPVDPTSIPASSSASNSKCLPGYYMCSMHYLGGCCKVGRNCDTTHCPPTGTTITTGSGVTIVESGQTSVRGASTCNSGMFSCPASVNGGCCPSGYRCGLTICTAGPNGVGNTAKESPSDASLHRWAGGLLIFALTAGIGMVVL